ncbi:alpha/beta fold hydrolase [Shewanella youngdeokensis]|uniref:Alpha/beta fold hydrolase n=1 Tax=Shewanella youngdeokensis TaxID=2999068 RepID=A0ABZ0K314_9GAMM|nr:alpha/beta fold hydrolase [Shewanella sp. DAU334]
MQTSYFTAALIVLLLQITGCSHTEAYSSTEQLDKELVVLAHGLGRSDTAMWRLATRLEQAGYKVCRLDYASIGESVEAVLAQTSKQIDACIQYAPKVHYVGHSLGGLVIRAYLQNNHVLPKESIGEVVLIGTPNKGSELADHLSDSWLMQLGGGISRALMTGSNSLGNRLEELDLNIGIIAGTKSSSLTNDKFTGANDGLVSVESAKLKNMSDFIAIDVNHSQMRNNQEVALQTIHFLQKTTFKH